MKGYMWSREKMAKLERFRRFLRDMNGATNIENPPVPIDRGPVGGQTSRHWPHKKAYPGNGQAASVCLTGKSRIKMQSAKMWNPDWVGMLFKWIRSLRPFGPSVGMTAGG